MSKSFVRLTFAALVVVATSSSAFAQATRTWVSGVGDDVNPCSRTAPCKTFAGAISKTAAGGEINVLDPGGYGGVTITKAITISSQFEAGVLVSGTNGIIINAGVNDVIHLSGLDVQGMGTGLNGIRFLNGAALHLDKSFIRGFGAGSSGWGISFQPAGASKLFVNDTTIFACGNAANSGGGILIQPTGTGSANVSLLNVRVQNNLTNGIRVDTTANTGTTKTIVSIVDSQINGNSHGITVVAPQNSAPIAMMLVDSTVAGNGGFGIIANAPSGAGASSAIVRVGNTSIFANTNGVLAAGVATIPSYGDNRLDSNTTDGSFSGVITPKK